MRVTLLHWKPAEAGPLIETLRRAGHDVAYHGAEGGGVISRAIRNAPPDVIVIDLSRLPSHGREVGIFLRGSKLTRHIPIVFVGGAPEKVEAIRKVLPDAIYASPETLARSVAKAKAPAAPVVPPQMMDRYAGRTVAQKLGIKEDSSIGVIDPPRDYAGAVGALPRGAVFQEQPRQPCAVTLWFVDNPESFHAALQRMRAIVDRTKLWVVWRKKSAQPNSGLDENVIRHAALAVGLVDYKVCAVDKTWSALALAVRKERGRRATA
jgi:hypothetical protein